jgi:hypothetical protein
MWINSWDSQTRVSFPALCPSAAQKFSFLHLTVRPVRQIMMEGIKMAENDSDVPFMQKLLDNHWLLLVIGVVSPTVLYTLWGIVDIMNTPLAK